MSASMRPGAGSADEVQSDILETLSRLVAFDTRNPPRALTGNSEVFGYLTSRLTGFDIDITNEGDGSVTLLAVRGAPKTVFNYHLDTVPVAEGWQSDPFELRVKDDRATGLGACDIKGALAVMLATCHRHDGDLAILVTSDEEAGQSRCIHRFCERDHGFARAVVAEPTQCQAVTAHRGIISGRLTFCGVAGHASEARAIDDNANHRLITWGYKLQQAVREAADNDTLANLRLNIGHVQGGVKPNMIAATATAAVNVRTPPGSHTESIVEAIRALAPAEHVEDMTLTFVAPALPSAPRTAAQTEVLNATISRLGSQAASPVDFWTEASLFNAAGCPALVFGSGNIAQAHTADEWVELEQLNTLHRHYVHWLSHGRA